MDAGLKAKWVKALRGKKFKQHRYTLKHPEKENALCCIGVCLAVNFPDEELSSHITGSAARKIGLTPEQKDTLVTMNDTEQKSFREIAKYVEANF